MRPILHALPAAALLAASSALAQPARPPATVLAIEAGVVHPIDAPPIEGGIVLIEGDRIRAVGPAGSIEVPEGATVLRFPDGHAYPGLVDASSTAFCRTAVLESSSTDAGSEIALALDPYDELSRALAPAGITTAYVASRGASTWRGIGALLRPRTDGFDLVDQAPGAVHLRMTSGPQPSHPLARDKQLRDIDKAFDGLEAYEKARAEYAEKLEEYEEEFDEYIAYHEKKKAEGGEAEKSGKKQDAEKKDEDEAKPAGAEPRPEGPERGRRRGPRGRRGGDRAEGGPAEAESKGEEGTEKPDGDAPKRPRFPKQPPEDPSKEALIAVRDGERTLWIEAHRGDEVRAALELERELSLRPIVLEGATAAAPLAAEIAERGVPVVLTEVETFGASPYLDPPSDELVGALHAAGVPIAIASGDVRRAADLPLLAARAAALGLGVEAAERAITLTPAEILGIGDRVGSLTAGKVADVLIASGPLLESGSRVVRVFAAGQPVEPAR